MIILVLVYFLFLAVIHDVSQFNDIEFCILSRWI